MAQAPPNIATFFMSPGVALEKQLGFLAHGIIVDNPTSQWWYVTAIDAYIQPYCLGWQSPIAQGVQVGKIVPQIPPGVLAPDPVPATVQQLARVIFKATSVDLSFGGVSIAPSPTNEVIFTQNFLGQSAQFLVLPRTVYGIEAIISCTVQGRIVIDIQDPATYGNLGIELLHSAFYIVEPTAVASMRTRRIFIPGIFPVNGTIGVRPATGGLGALGPFQGNVTLVGALFNSRSASPNVTSSTEETIALGTGLVARLLQCTGFKSVELLVNNPGTVALTVTLKDVESQTVITAPTVIGIGGSAQISLDERALPDALQIDTTVPVTTAGTLTIKASR